MFSTVGYYDIFCTFLVYLKRRFTFSKCCGSEFIFFPDPDPTLSLISDPDSNPDPLVYEKYIRKSDHLSIA